DHICQLALLRQQPLVEQNCVFCPLCVEVAREPAPGSNGHRHHPCFSFFCPTIHLRQVGLNTVIRAVCRQVADEVVDSSEDEDVSVLGFARPENVCLETATHLVDHVS